MSINDLGLLPVQPYLSYQIPTCLATDVSDFAPSELGVAGTSGAGSKRFWGVSTGVVLRAAGSFGHASPFRVSAHENAVTGSLSQRGDAVHDCHSLLRALAAAPVDVIVISMRTCVRSHEHPSIRRWPPD